MIRIDSLRFSYAAGHRADDGKAALVDVSLAIAPQNICGLLGPNGAGKTTLLSILSGLLPCPPRSVFVDGVDIADSVASHQSTLSLVPQECAFYSSLSVLENLRFFAGIQAITGSLLTARIDEVVAIAGLGDRLDDRTEHLSGGLRRRLNLAIGLLNRPQLLLLDEPTVGIDPHSRRFILQAIKELNRAGTTIVYTSHYMEEVQYLCDDIVIIDDGRVLRSGPLQTLLRSGASPEDGPETLVIDLDLPLAQEHLARMQAQIPVTQTECSLTIPVGDSSRIYESLAWLQQHGVNITGVHYGARNLEELFLQLTRRSLRD